MREIKGKLVARESSIGIVVGRFNEAITKNLLEGAIDTLKRCGLEDDSITVVWVPGAFELPLAAKTLCKTGSFDAVICLGAVIRGATPHFDYVCAQAASGIAQVSLDTEIPVVFGVLTTETIEQAVERSGTKAGNKGSDSALCAIEMANLLHTIELSPVQ
jgi:6,7-dimethyl-8-ribityllumazine synthase